MSTMSRVVMAVAAVVMLAQSGLAYKCDQGFVRVSDRWCIYVVIAATVNNEGSIVRWPQAQSECIGLGGHLLVLDQHDKMLAISQHLDKEYPAETASGYVFWVGGRREFGQWKWETGSKMDLTSHLWVPGQPQKDGQGVHTLLVPADSNHGRRYMTASAEDGLAPAYICEG